MLQYQSNLVAVLRGDHKVQVWNVADACVKQLCIHNTLEDVVFSYDFFKLVCVGPEETLFCILRGFNPAASMRNSQSGSISLWQIALPSCGGPNEEQLGIYQLGHVLQAIKDKGASEQIEVLNLNAVRLCDEDVPDLLVYLGLLPSLTRIDLTNNHCALIDRPESHSSVEGATSAKDCKEKTLTPHALVRIFVELQGTQRGTSEVESSRQVQVPELALDGKPVTWRQACEWVEGRDAGLHADLVAASNAQLLKQYTIALEDPSLQIQTPQLVRMFESVLCVGDLRWPYTLFNAVLLAGETPSDQKTQLYVAFESTLNWLAQHAMFNSTCVADFKAVLRSALRHRLLGRNVIDTLETSAIEKRCVLRRPL